MSKQTSKHLKALVEDYLGESDKDKVMNLAKQIADSLWRDGFQNFNAFFTDKFSKKQKIKFLDNLFEILKNSEPVDKLSVMEVLKDILINSDIEIKELIISVYYDELFNEEDFKSALQSLKIFVGIWDYVDDNFKLKIYDKLLEFVDKIEEDILVEEGFFEILDLIEKYPIEIIDIGQKKRLFNVIAKQIEVRKERSIKYAGFESLKKLIDTNKSMINEENYNIVFYLLNKLTNYKYPDVLLSLLRLFLLFERFIILEHESDLREIIINIKKRLDSPDIQPFFEIFREILLSKKKFDKNAIMRENFDLFQRFNKKRSTLEDYTLDLFNEIINLMWPILTDKEKGLFYKD